MGVPSSGQLRLRADINQEINGNDTDTNVSLGTLSNDAGFTEPDTMSEFYGYVDAVAPTLQWWFYSVNSGPTADGDVQFRWMFNSDGGAQVTDYGVYVGTNSSSPTANTKYQSGTGTPSYFNYQSLTGLSNNTTYYVWAYATNSVGTTFTSNLTQPQSFTVPAPYIPVTHNSLTATGDWNYFCPNYNFNGMFRPNFVNSTTSTNIDVYGDGNFSHTNSAKPNCLATFGTYGATSSARTPACPFSSSTCTITQSCGGQITGYLKYYISGYSDKIYSHTGQCIQC